MAGIAESHVEEAALEWFEELNWSVLHGPDSVFDRSTPERTSYSDVILRGRLETAVVSFNPTLPTQDKDEAMRKVLGDEILSTLARELADTVRKNATIDWTMKESVRAKLRVFVKRTLRKYNYPPDIQKKATETVIQQAELLGAEWGK